MPLDISDLSTRMLGAARGVLQERWAEARPYAEKATGQLTQAIGHVEQEVLAGRMTPKRARLHLEMQADAALAVLLALRGLSQLAAEQAINAALGVVKDAVNAAVRFPLL